MQGTIELDSGKVPQEPDSVLSDSTADLGSQQAFAHTLVPLKIPALWFGKCNNCDKIFPFKKLVIPLLHASTTIRDMLLCRLCRREFRLWTSGRNMKGGRVRRDHGRSLRLHPFLMPASTSSKRWKQIQSL